MDPALRDLLEHAAALRRLASDLVGDAAADDVLQDVAVVALRGGVPAEAAPRGWWFGVVRNLAGKRRRGEAIRRRHEAQAARDDVHVERSAEAADSLCWLTAELTALPEPYRGALLGRYVRDLSPTEIAAETGEPVRTVKTRLQRGLGLLRERFEARGGDWRAGLVAAFGIERAATKAAGGAAVTLIGGVMLMNTMAKVAVGAAAVTLAAGLWWWQPWRGEVQATLPANGGASAVSAVGQGAVPQPAATAAPVGEEASVAVEREEVAGAAAPRDGTPVAADGVVVLVRDEDDGSPIVDFALRRHRSAQMNLLARETPRLFAGEHDGGRLVMPVAELGRDNFVVEVPDGSYLPSRWFDAADVQEVDGQRVIEVALPKPVEQVVRVVLEGKSTPVADTVVELLRPWPGHEPVTLRTNAVSSDKLRAQVDEPAITVAFTGGRALLLQRATTDADGRITLRVPPGEDLGLRLLGPGHQPRVETPWRVERTAAAVDRVVAVAGGAVVEVHAFPRDALRRMRMPPLPEALRDQVTANMLASYVVGVGLHDPVRKAMHPPQRGLSWPPLPFDEDGVARFDGVEPGDWQLRLSYPLRLEPDNPSPLASTGAVTVELPAIRGLQSGERRIVEIDLSPYLSGTVRATVLLNGHARPEYSVVVTAVAANGAPLPSLSPNLRVDADGRFAAPLPPARYFAAWHRGGGLPALPLGEFVVSSGVTTEVAFSVDPGSAQVRVLEADGVAAAGIVQLLRPGWSCSGQLDEHGAVSFEWLPRGDTLQVSLLRRDAARPDGGVTFAAPCEVGQLEVGASGDPVVFRLPKR